MEMKSSFCKIALAIFFLPAVLASQTSTQRKGPPSTPAPNSPISQTLPTPVMHGPTYSPAQLEFGAVELSSSAMRNFSLTTPAAGEITLEFPVGPFTIADVRTVHPLNFSQLKSQMASMPPGKPTPLAKSAYTETYKWNLAAGDEMQFTIIFFPILFNSKPALRTASMKFSGPGPITPWTVTIPLHGTLASSSANMTPQQPGGKNPMATVDSAPIPSALSPRYSPAQLDFGSLWDGESSRRTFSLTPPAPGTITLSFPGGGLFWLVEYREMGGAKVASKNPNIGALKQVKASNTYQVGQPVPGYLQYTVSAGSEIQLDFVFQPVSQPKGGTGTVAPGQKSVIVKLSGPGAITPWSVTIPLRGTFNGPKM